jgi:hypothetical protein
VHRPTPATDMTGWYGSRGVAVQVAFLKSKGLRNQDITLYSFQGL